MLKSIFLLLIGIFLSCSSINKRDHAYSYKDNQKISTKVIIAYLENPLFHKDIISKGKIQIDPSLEIRDSLVSNGKLYFNDPMHSSLLKMPLPELKARFIIPDSLKHKYEYLTDRSDMEHEYAVIHFFSTLLPTDKPDTFLMEHIEWFNLCSDGTCGRFLGREFIHVVLKKETILDITFVNIYKQSDFYSYGTFKQEQMEKAKPGEKLGKFKAW